MDNPRPEKVAVVTEVRERFERSSAAILTEYRGLTVKDIAALRRTLREAGSEYKIYKNTLVRFAAHDLGLSELDSLLTGPTAIAFVDGDAASVAKALREYARTNPKLTVKGGVLGNRIMSVADASALADLPPREVVLARLAGALASPMQTFAGLLAAVPRNFAYGLKALLEKRGARRPATMRQACRLPSTGKRRPPPTHLTPLLLGRLRSLMLAMLCPGRLLTPSLRPLLQLSPNRLLSLRPSRLRLRLSRSLMPLPLPPRPSRLRLRPSLTPRPSRLRLSPSLTPLPLRTQLLRSYQSRRCLRPPPTPTSLRLPWWPTTTSPIRGSHWRPRRPNRPRRPRRPRRPSRRCWRMPPMPLPRRRLPMSQPRPSLWRRMGSRLWLSRRFSRLSRSPRSLSRTTPLRSTHPPRLRTHRRLTDPTHPFPPL